MYIIRIEKANNRITRESKTFKVYFRNKEIDIKSNLFHSVIPQEGQFSDNQIKTALLKIS